MSIVNSKTLFITLTLVGAAVLVSVGLLTYQSTTPAPAAQAASTGRVTVKDGLTIITLDEATLKLGGIQTTALHSIDRQEELVAHGDVLDVQALIDLRGRYLSTQADVAAAQAASHVSEQELKRDRQLFLDDKNVSQKTVQMAQAVWAADIAKLRAAEANLQLISASTRRQFGASVAEMVALNDSPQLARFLNQQDVILRIILPSGSNPVVPQHIQVDADDHNRFAADYLSTSPQSDPILAGRAYLYRVSTNLPISSKVVAFLPIANGVRSGVIIPESAVLWFGGQPWAYVQINKGQFVRRPVAVQSPYGSGFFVTEKFKSGEQIVTLGAQLLLSEEQRPQITSMVCKDPECDD
nr:hypothetical protein [uncultured Tolumonas sp.]